MQKKRFIVISVVMVLFAIVNPAQAIWIHMGDGTIGFERARACRDGFTMTGGFRPIGIIQNPPTVSWTHLLYARTYPYPMDGHQYPDLYAWPSPDTPYLPNEQNPEPSIIVAYGSLTMDNRSVPFLVFDNYMSSYYGFADIPWLDGLALPFDDHPYVNAFRGQVPDEYAMTMGFFHVTDDVEDCYLFGAPNLSVPGTQNADAGVPLVIANIGQFTDASYAYDGVNPTFDFSINWGDGTPPDTGLATLDTIGTPYTSTLGSFDGAHTYANAGTYTVTVSVDDNDDGVATETFSVEVFGPPGLLEPGAVTSETRPSFAWGSVAGATSYEIQLGMNNPPQTIVQNAASTQFKPASDLNYTTYYWRVRSVNAANHRSQWSEIRSVSITAPDGARPAQNFVMTDTPALMWNPITGSTGYEIQVSTNAQFTLLSDTQIVTEDEISVTTVPLPRGYRYYWRVRAKDGAGVWGKWSASQTFTIALP